MPVPLVRFFRLWKMVDDGGGREARPQRELLVSDCFQPSWFCGETSGGMVVADKFWLGFEFIDVEHCICWWWALWEELCWGAVT